MGDTDTVRLAQSTRHEMARVWGNRRIYIQGMPTNFLGSAVCGPAR